MPILAERCNKKTGTWEGKNIVFHEHSMMTNNVAYANRRRETRTNWRVLTSVTKASTILFHRAKNNKAKDRMKHTDSKH